MRYLSWALVSLGYLHNGVLGQVFVGSNSTAAPITMPAGGKLSNSCNATFFTRVTCDPTLLNVAYDGYFPTTDDLSSLCTQSCVRALNSLYRTQKSACTKGDTLSSSGYIYPATFTVETLLWTYNYTCRRDPESGNFCAPIFDAWGDGEADNQTCSDCVLGTYQAQMNFPLGYDDGLAKSFSSMTSSCSAINYPITSPAPATIPQSTKPTPSPSSSATPKKCASTYTIKDGDDCHSISRSQSVSLANMLYLNNLEAGCTHFPGAGKKLCMPNKCQIYTVKKDDSCFGITEVYKNAFTMSQLVSWNVDINNGCDNLEMLVGHQICVSYPGDGGGLSSSVTPAASTPAPSWSCWDLNGHVPSSCFVTTYETLPPWVWPGYRTNSSSGMSHSRTSTPATSLTPVSLKPIPSSWTLPQVTSSSRALNPTPKPYDPSMVSGCSDYYMMKKNDNCTDIADRWGLSVEQMTSWNPSLKSDCSNITTGEYICMARDYTSTTTSATATATSHSTSSSDSELTSTTGGPPGPTQTGIASDCTKWLMRTDKGKYCQDMADEAGISLDCFYKLNPAVNTKKGKCQGLLQGEAYCVGTESNVCE